jgi:hypothetical protein
MMPSLRSCFCLLALALAGCSPAFPLAPVRGRATLGDKGLERVTIQMVPDASKGTNAPAGVAQTDVDGSFKITTPPHGDGAVPGHYKVTVTSYTGKGIPPIYADPLKTPLRVEIPPAGLESWDLKLKSK